jgi:hypothetical protein
LEVKQKKGSSKKLLPFKISVQYLHDLAAAAGDYIARLNVHQLVADGTIDITFFFCPNDGVQAVFQFVFHSFFLISDIRLFASPE